MFSLIQQLRKRIASSRRLQPTQQVVILDRKHVYIVPTRQGLLFALILLIMLMGSINYNNSTGYLFTFLLASMTMVSILHTHRNLLGLRIETGKVTPVFVGEIAVFQLWLDNREQPTRHTLLWHRHPHHDNPFPITLNVPTHQRINFTIEVLARHRGYLPLGQLIVYTRFPLGLFRAWAYIHLNLTTLAYPTPRGQDTLPLGQHHAETGEGSPHEGGGEDFIGYRAYQSGDSPRHIDWKAVARGQNWLIKQFGGQGTATVWLNWEDVNHLNNTEMALSQLCLWILTADKAGAEYGLVLPDMTFEPAHGEQHRARCLKALALFGQKDTV